jgi:uncharacterized protein (TIGR03435 family)
MYKMLLLAVSALAAVMLPAQSVVRPVDTPKWEAVSIKPCKPNEGGRGRGGGGAGAPIVGPGRLDFKCTTAARLIAQAYLSLPDGRRNLQASMDGAPSWIDSESYEIHAKAEGTPRQDIMNGPMLQVILEDRFSLKVHWEMRQVPVYAITALKGGIKLQPLEAGSCDPRDPTKPPRPVRGTPDGMAEVLQPGQKPTCAMMSVMSKSGGDPGTILMSQASNLTEFASALRLVLDRPVIDRTVIPGMFNFRMQFAGSPGKASPPENSPSVGALDPAGPSIFTAIQEQIGLKLESTRGPAEFLVVDRVERPTEN